AGQRKLPADGPEHGVPSFGEGGTVQEHAVEVPQLAAWAARADGRDQIGGADLVLGNVGNLRSSEKDGDEERGHPLTLARSAGSGLSAGRSGLGHRSSRSRPTAPPRE